MEIQQKKNDNENLNNTNNNDFDFLSIFNDKSVKSQPINSFNENINEEIITNKQDLMGLYINKHIEETIEEQKNNFTLNFETPLKNENNIKILNNLSSKKSNNPFEEINEDSVSKAFNAQNKQKNPFNIEPNGQNSNTFSFVDEFFQNNHGKNEKNNLFLSFSDSKFQAKASQLPSNQSNSNEIDLL